MIILIDKRFRRDRIRAKLPGWIRNAGLTDPLDVGDSLDRIEKVRLLSIIDTNTWPDDALLSSSSDSMDKVELVEVCV